MYEEFYNLKEKPFNLTPSPRFLYLSEQHREALSLLTYGVVERKGFILLTGEVGTGKTTIVQTLIENLGQKIKYVYLANPMMSPMDFINYLAFSAFNKKIHYSSKSEFLFEFEEFLREGLRHRINFILIIDEAQRLSFKLLEEIRLLSNMESAEEKLINIFLVGQPELNEKLNDPRCRPLLQRISIRYNISPLDLNGVRDYIAARLRIAGAKEGEEIFSKNAVKTIYECTLGYPRLINVLADNALLLGYSRDQKKITHQIIEECYGDLKLGDSSWKKIDQQKPEPPDTGKAERIYAGRYWKWATFFLIIIFMLIFGLTQTGQNLWQELFRGEVVGDQIPARKGSPRPALINEGKKESVGEASSKDPPKNHPLPPVPKIVGKIVQLESETQPGRLEHDMTDGTESHVPEIQSGRDADGVSVSKEESKISDVTEVREPKTAQSPAAKQEEHPGAGNNLKLREKAYKIVVVKEGDTLSKLMAEIYGRFDGVILQEVKKQNPKIWNVDLIEIGQEVIFPIVPKKESP
jgi:type II secretory pathway predicted ATPase ExeA